MENPIKMDDLGVPLFLETPIYLCLQPFAHSLATICAFAQKKNTSPLNHDSGSTHRVCSKKLSVKHSENVD